MSAPGSQLVRSSRRTSAESKGQRPLGGGAKDGDQGECGLAKHAPDTAPGERVTGAGTHTAGGKQSLCRHTPEVGAGCGKVARPDLGGGRAMKRTSLPLQRRGCPRWVDGVEKGLVITGEA